MALGPDFGVSRVEPTSTPPDNYQRLNPSLGAFGGAQAEALQGFGRDLEKTSNNVFDAGVMLQERYNKTAVQQTTNQFLDKLNKIVFIDPDDTSKKGFLSLEGQDAMNAYKPTVDAIKGAYDELNGGLHNDAQRLAFGDISRRYLHQYQNMVGQHADKESNKYHDTTGTSTRLNATVSSALTWNNEALIATNLDRSRQSTIEQLQRDGLAGDPENVKRFLREKSELPMVISIANARSEHDPVGALDWVKNGTLPGALTTDANGKVVRGPAIKVNDILDEGNRESLVAGLRTKMIKARTLEIQQTVSGGGAPSGKGAPIVDQTLPPEAQRFLPALAAGESPGYDIRYTPGGGTKFSGYAEHPNIPEPGPEGPSTAAGRYQFTKSTWNRAVSALGLTDFSPQSQDRAAWWNAQRVYSENTKRNLQDDLREGGHEQEIASALKNEWTSLRSAKGAQQFATMARSTPAKGVAGEGPPDLDKWQQQAREMAGDDYELQQHAVAGVTNLYHQRMAATAVERADLQRDIHNLGPALEAGQDHVIPEQRIRSLLPAPEAQRTIETLQIQQSAGQMFKEAQWATPETINSMQQDLESGLGRYSTALRMKGGQAGGPGLVTDPNAPETPENFNVRRQVATTFQKIVDQRQAVLNKDPAAYVSMHPSVKAAYAAINPNDPATAEAYVRASLAVQSQLGVPEAAQSALTKTQAASVVGKILNATADKTDVSRQMNGLAKQWGGAYQRVFGDLVKAGLPGGYQVLATMDRPEQAGAAADLQEGMALAHQKGGVHKMAEAAPDEAVKDINTGIDDKLSDFRQTVAFSPGGTQLYDHVKDAAKLLAYTYAMRGESSSRAMTHAVDGIIGLKYDLNGTWRSPKEYTDATKQATRLIQNGITANDLGDIAGNDRLTSDERKQSLLSGIRSDGKWLNNPDETGVVLTYLARGRREPVIGHDGKPVQYLFGAPMPSRRAGAPSGMGGEPRDLPGIQQEGVGSWLGSFFGGSDEPEVTMASARPFPTPEDAQAAREADADYGSGAEAYTRGRVQNALSNPPRAGSQREAINPPEGTDLKTVSDPRFGGNVAGTPETADRYETARLAASRSPIAAIGFDPRRFNLDTKSGDKMNVAGAYDPGQDSGYSNVTSKSNLVHESTHRGLELLRRADVVPKSLWDRLPREELIVRYIMAAQMGDIEAGVGSVGDSQRAEGLASFGRQSSDPQKDIQSLTTKQRDRRAALAELEHIAATHFQSLHQGPR